MTKFLELRELTDKIAKNVEIIDEKFIDIFIKIHNLVYENLGRNYLLNEEINEMYNILLTFDEN